MPIPDFRDDGWLPEGHHAATWDEIADALGGEPSSVRATVLAGLLAWRDAVRVKGLSGLVILDGSFVSAKPNPGDFDLVFLYHAEHEPVANTDDSVKALLDLTKGKAQFGGDIFAFSERAVGASLLVSPNEMFDYVKFTTTKKGVLETNL